MESKGKIKYVMLLLVGLLLVFSVVQAVQINEIKESGAAVQGRTVASAPLGVQAQAPSMVGGC